MTKATLPIYRREMTTPNATRLSHWMQHLIQLGPQKNLPRQTIYNFFKNFYDLSLPLSDLIFEDFFRTVYRFPFWQERQKEFSDFLRQDLFPFVKTFQVQVNQDYLLQLSQAQILSLKNKSDFEEVLKRYKKKDLTEGRSLKIFQRPTKDLLCLHISPNEQITVETFQSICLVLKGDLIPLAPLSKLVYNSQLELLPQALHWLETEVVTVAAIQVTTQGCEALFLKTPTYQKIDTYSGPIYRSPSLFYALKGLEKFYVNLKTDPFYTQLLRSMEEALEALNSLHPNGEALAGQALRQGRMILRHLMPEDQLLQLLCHSLERAVEAQNQKLAAFEQRPPVDGSFSPTV